MSVKLKSRSSSFHTILYTSICFQEWCNNLSRHYQGVFCELLFFLANGTTHSTLLIVCVLHFHSMWKQGVILSLSPWWFKLDKVWKYTAMVFTYKYKLFIWAKIVAYIWIQFFGQSKLLCSHPKEGRDNLGMQHIWNSWAPSAVSCIELQPSPFTQLGLSKAWTHFPCTG